MKQFFRFSTTSGLFVHSTPTWTTPVCSAGWEFNAPLQAEAPWSVAGTFRKLYIAAENAAAGDITFTVYKNGVATSLSAVVPSLTLTGSDTTNSFTIAPGDYISLRAVRPAGSDSAGFLSGSIEFEATSASESGYSAKIGPELSNSAIINNGFLNPFLPEQGWSASSDPGVVAAPGVINRFDVKLTVSPGANVWKFVFIKNGVVQDSDGGTPDTRISITGATTGTLSGFSLPVAAGDTLSVGSFITSGSVTTIRAGVSFRFIPTVEGEMTVNIRSQFTFSAGNTRYVGIYGFQSGAFSEGEYLLNEYDTWKFRKLYVRPSGGAWGSTGVVFVVRKNSVDTAMGGTVINSGVNAVDLSNHIDIVPTNKITIRGTGNSGITSRAGLFAYVLFNGAEPLPVGTGDFVAPDALLVSTGYAGDPDDAVGNFHAPLASLGGSGFTGPPVTGTATFTSGLVSIRGAGTQYPRRLTLYINGIDYNEWWWTQDAWDVSKDGPQETAHFSVRDPLSGHTAKRVTKGDTFLILHPEGGLICGGEVTEVVETSLIEGIGTVCRCTGEDWMFLLDQIYIFPQRFLPQPVLDFWAAIYDKYLAPKGWINLSPRIGGPELPELIVDKTIHLRELFNRVEQKVPWPLRVNGMKEAALNEPGALIWPYGELNGDNCKISSDVQVTEEVAHIPTRYIIEGVEPPYGKGPVLHNENRWSSHVSNVVFPVNVLPTKITGQTDADFAATTNTLSLKELPPGMKIRWADEFFIGTDPRRYFVGLGTFTVGGDGKVTIATDTIELDGKADTEVIFQEGAGINLIVNGVPTEFDGGPSHWVWDKTENQFVYTGGTLVPNTHIRYEAWIEGSWIMRAWETADPPPIAFSGAFDYDLVVDEVLENEDMWNGPDTVAYMRSKLAEPYTSKKILDITTHVHGLYPYIVTQCSFPKRNSSGTWVVEKVDVRSNGADPASTLNDLVYHATLRKDIYGKSIWGFFQPVSKLKWGSGSLVGGCVPQGTPILYEDFSRIPTDFGAWGSIFNFIDSGDDDDSTTPGIQPLYPGDYWEQPYWGGGSDPQEYVYTKALVTEGALVVRDGRGYGGLPAFMGNPAFYGYNTRNDVWSVTAMVFHQLGNIVHAEYAEDYPYFYNYLAPAHQLYMTCYYSFTEDSLTDNGWWPYYMYYPLFGLIGSGFVETCLSAMSEAAFIPSFTIGVNDYDSAMGSGMDTDPVSTPASFTSIEKAYTIFVPVSVWGYNAASPGTVTDNIGSVYSLLSQTGTPGAAGIRVYKATITVDVGAGEWFATYTPAIAERATIGAEIIATDAIVIDQIVTKHNSGTSHNAGLAVTTNPRATTFGFLASSTPGNSGYTAVGGEPSVGWFQVFNVNPTNSHAQLISMYGRAADAGTNRDVTWTSSVSAESEVIGIEINHPGRNDPGAWRRAGGFEINTMLDTYTIDPITGYWDYEEHDEYYGPFSFDSIENRGPLKCTVCYRGGTFTYDPESDITTLAADGWYKLSINGVLLVHIEGIPLYIADSTFEEDWQVTHNTILGLDFGWYGLAGELSSIRITGSGQNLTSTSEP